jgi:hypothetical protein
MWDENDTTDGVQGSARARVPVSLDDIDDGRCKGSSWRNDKTAKPTYQNHFGPGGFNRCVGTEGHANPLHKDEWGNVFTAEPFRVVRKEWAPNQGGQR